MKKYQISAVIIAIIIILPTSYFLLDNGESIDGTREEKTYSFYYSVKIYNAAAPVNCTFIVPFPDFQENVDYWTERLLTDSTQEGQMNISIVTTSHGKGLMINTSFIRFEYSEDYRRQLTFALDEKIPADNLTMGYEDLGNMFYVEYDDIYKFLAVDLEMHNYEIIDDVKHGTREFIHINALTYGWSRSKWFGHISYTLP